MSKSEDCKVSIVMEEHTQIKDKFKLLKELVRLIKENEVSAWLENGNDSSASSVSAEDAGILNKFFPDDGVHIMWKEIFKGNLEDITSWIATTKERGEDIYKVDKANELNALHYAILFNKKEIAMALLESEGSGKWGKIPQKLLFGLGIMDEYTPPAGGPVNIGTIIDGIFWKDALDAAVDEDRLEDVKLLMQHGANPMLNCKDELEGYCSILERAILSRKRPMVMAMLNKEGREARAWELDKKKLLDIKDCINYKQSDADKEKHRHSPFSKLVENLPDVAAMVLDNCITPEGAPHEEDYGISFDCSLLENETSNANKFYRGFPCAYWYDLARHDKDTGSSWDECTEAEAVADNNYDAYKKHHHPLYKVMQSNDPVLLNHPVVKALLEKKLKMFGWLIYYFNLFLYVLLVSTLTAFLLILPNPQDPQCVQRRELEGNLSLSEEEDFELSSENLTCSVVGLLPELSALKIVGLILAFLCLILELYQLYSRRLVGYFNDWVNWVELVEYICIIIFLLSVERGECFCPQTWEWELGVISLAWVVLIVWLQVMPWIGIYVTILLRIMASFARVAIFGVVLVVGFGLTFYLLFFQPPQDESVNEPSIFGSPLRANLSVISLTAGEFDTGGVLYSNSADSPSLAGRQYESLTFIIWLAGVVITSVLFINLLVGLAVGEVHSALDEACITIIKQRIELVLTQEEQFPEFIHRRIIQTKPIVVYPNKRNIVQYWLLLIPVVGCCLCSWFVCYNNNHARYWVNMGQSTKKYRNKKFKELPGLIEKTGSESEVDDSPVTKQVMKHGLEHKLTVLEDKMKTVLKDELKEQVTVIEDKTKKQLSVMQDMPLEINEKLKETQA